MFDMNSGYSGYSMSNRACEAYESGEKPLSKWTKTDMFEAIAEYIEENNVTFTMSTLKKAPKSVITDLVLRKSSWHHTSSYCNETDFFSVDYDLLEQLTDEKITDAITAHKVTGKEKPLEKKYKGSFTYLEWSGTRNHPKATQIWLKDVWIEEKGCFYIVTDQEGKQLVKKKIGSNGTSVTNYEEEERRRLKEEEKLRQMKKISSKAAWEFYESIKNNCSYSSSGHIYICGRKPTRMDYECGLEKFFDKGEHRLYQDYNTKALLLETWDGKEWISEE